MVAIFTGAGTGFERGSGSTLGASGLLGSSSFGRSGQQLFLNAANGNLMISRQDEFLVGRGPDVGISRTYNSLGNQSDDNGDNWRQSTERVLFDIVGAVGSWGSTLKRRSGDGSEIAYAWNGSAYVATDGAGAYDTITYAGGYYTWTDGDSRVTETYGQVGTDWRILSQSDTSGNTLTFQYTNGKLYRVTTADGGYTQYDWSGNNISQIVTGYTDLATSTAKTLTRTRYGYDASNRLSTVTIDESPEDNSVTDGNSYTTTYTYFGTTDLVATISESDGSYLAITYDGNNRVWSFSQAIGDGHIRTTTLDYGANYTTVTDPLGQVTRLDYAAGNFAAPLDSWPTGNLDRQPATIDGKAATKYTVQTGGTWSGVTSALAAGETITFGLTLQASGTVTSQALGLWGDVDGWGTNDISSARIVSGPGQLVQIAGGFWRIDGLSTTQGTRIEIIRTYKQAQSGGAYFYVDYPGGYRAGTSLVVADPSLTRGGGALATAQMDLNNWGINGASKTSAGTIDGSPAYQLTVTDHSWSGISTTIGTARPGEQIGLSMSFMAVAGSATSQSFGLYGGTSGWGGNATARIISGPGTLTQDVGGRWRISGLSTTQATRVEVVRTYDQLETAYAYVYADLPGGHRIGQSLIASAPYAVRRDFPDARAGQLLKITAPAAYSGGPQQVVQFGYDDKGNLTSVTDASGNGSAFTFDANGNTLTATDRLGNTVTRTYNSDNQVVTETRTGSDKDIAAASHTTRYVYDSAKRLRFIVSAEGYVTEYIYNAAGAVNFILAYPGQAYDISGLASTTALIESQLTSWRSSVNPSAVTQAEAIYDARGNLTRQISYGGTTAAGTSVTAPGYSDTRYVYDQAGQLRSTTVIGQNTETFVYDGLGRVTARTDVNGGTTSFVFNDAATQTVVTLANGFVQTSTYNKVGELVSFTESSANLTNGGTATYKYDADGRVRVMIDASGVETYYLYDKAGRRVAEATGAGTLIEYRYDANDRIVATVRYANAISAAQLAALQDPNSTAQITDVRPGVHAQDLWTWSIYDKEGHVLEAIEGDGAVTAYDYDASGRLIATRGFVNKLSAAQISGFKTTAPTSVVLPTAHANDTVSRIFFDKDGRTIGVLDATGYLTRTIYDAAGRKVQEIAYANATTAGIRATGTFQALINSVGSSTNDRGTRYIYDGQGFLRFTIDALNHVAAYYYGDDSAAFGALRQTTRYAGTIGALASYDYETVRTAVTALASDPANRVSYSIYDSAGRVAYAIDATGAVIGYSYDTLGQLTKKVAYATTRATTSLPTKATMDGWASANPSSADRVTRYYYDGRGALRYTIDAEGYVTRSDYDAAGRVTWTGRYDTAVAATDAWTILTVSGAASGTYAGTSNYYDAAGRLTYVVGPEADTRRYYYYANGQLAYDMPDEGGIDESRTYFVYDAAGRLVTRYDAYGRPEQAATQYEYDGFGNLTKTIDANLHATTRTYDKLGRVLSETNAASGVTSYEYDAFGDVVRTTDARGNSTYSYYDKQGRATLMRDAENYVTETSFTAFGEVAWVKRWFTAATNTAAVGTLPTGHAGGNSATTSFVYDKLGRVLTTTDAEGGLETSQYNAFGEAIRFTNKLGGVTQYVFNRRGLMASQDVYVPVYNANGTLSATTFIRTTYDYDARGNLIHQAEGSNFAEKRETWFAYDKADRLTAKTGAQVAVGTAGTLTTPGDYYAYDKRSNLIESWDASGAHSWYYYDDLDRKTAQIVAVTATQGSYSAFAYDANGNLVSSKAYGGWASLPSVAGGAAPAVPAGGYRETVYTYDNINRVLTQSVAGQVIGSWNGTSYVTSTGALTTTYEYDAMGNVVKTTAPDGGMVFSYYDKLGRKTAQVDQERYLTAWTFDAEGNATSERRYATQAGTPTTSAPPSVATNAADRVTDFTYDEMGNRLTETRRGVEAWVVNATNGQLSLASTDAQIVYTYNAVGQVLTKREASQDLVTYTYDSAGRLTRENRAAFVDQSGVSVTPTVRYYYNAVGDLVRTVQGGAALNIGFDRVTINFYDTRGLLLRTTDPALSVRDFIYDAAGHKTGEYYTRDTGTGGLKVEGISYQYDRAGNLTRQGINTISGTTWTEASYSQSAYDAYGEVTDRGTNGWQEQFAYDGAGRLTKSNAGDGVWRFHIYDAAGNQTMVVESEGADIHLYTQADAIALATSNDINSTITVHDKRGQATSTIQRQRELGFGARQDIATDRAYNAFGELLWEEDAYDRRTDYTYNTMGRTTKVERPTVSVTAENGTQSNVRPTEKYFYDLSGRLVGAQDANSVLAESLGGTGYKTTQLLLAGTGYGGSAALVIKEWHPDGGAVTSKYDVFGDLRTTTDEIGRTTSMAYDGMGRLTQVTKPGGLTEYYAYDVLGQRTAHWNSVVGAGAAEKTEYDQLGRITRQVAYGGDVTTTSYQWLSDITTTGMGTFGGWLTTTTYQNTLSSYQKDDVFGHTTWKKDLGAHETLLSYDLAGRMTGRTIGAETSNYAWLSNGQVGTITTTISGLVTTQTSTYDKAGNKLTEYQTRAGTVIQNATATYDALSRLSTWSEAGNTLLPASTMAYAYDVNSNIRRMQATYRYLDQSGAAYPNVASQDSWYRYDSMNRMVTSEGSLVSGAITGGRQITYDAAGQRISVSTVSSGLVWTGWKGTYKTNQSIIIYQDYPGDLQEDGYVWTNTGRSTYTAKAIESYTYNADGSLATVSVSAEGVSVDWGVFTPTGVMGASVLRASFSYDSQGRLSSQTDYDRNGTTVVYSRSAIVYNAKGQITSETSSALQSTSTTVVTNTTYDYGTGAAYALGAVVTTDADIWSNGSDAAAPDTRTTSSYAWYDGAVQSAVTYKPDVSTSTSYTTSYTLTPSGQVSAAHIGDGRPRDVSFTLDAYGQTVRRDEADSNTSLGDPHAIWYRFNGRQLGSVGNDSLEDGDYLSSIAARQTAQGTGPFRNGQNYGGGFARFGEAYVPYTSYAQGAGGGSYTADGGETLSGIAAQLWGDSDLWYELAQANGLGTDATLAAGQTINIPTGVTRSSNRSDTFKPFDPAETLGNLNPTTPKPQAKKNKCGIVGQIIIAAIAVAITVALPGSAPIYAQIAGAMSGSFFGQAVGVAIGAQDDIDLKGIAMAGITAGLTAGLAKIPGLDGAKGALGTLQDAARGALANAGAQGIAIATGMQKKFDFTGVAAAGAVAGVSSAVGGKLGISATNRGSFGARVATATASALAGAATRSVIDGTDFGDNVIAVLPDVIAQTIGAGLEDAIRPSHSRTDAQLGKLGSLGARMASVGQTSDASAQELALSGANVIDMGALSASPSLAVVGEPDIVSNDEIVVRGMRRTRAPVGSARPIVAFAGSPDVPFADVSPPGSAIPPQSQLGASDAARRLAFGLLTRVVPGLGTAGALLYSPGVGGEIGSPIDGTDFTIGGRTDDFARYILDGGGNKIATLQQTNYPGVYGFVGNDGQYGMFTDSTPVPGRNAIIFASEGGDRRGFAITIESAEEAAIVSEGLANGQEMHQIENDLYAHRGGLAPVSGFNMREIAYAARGVPFKAFPKNPSDLTDILGAGPTKISKTADGTTRMVWEPNANTRIRYESHPEGLSPGDPRFNPRHHGEHYHIEIKPDGISWNKANKTNSIIKVKPQNYTPGTGTGFLPGEKFPGL